MQLEEINQTQNDSEQNTTKILDKTDLKDITLNLDPSKSY